MKGRALEIRHRGLRDPLPSVTPYHSRLESSGVAAAVGVSSYLLILASHLTILDCRYLRDALPSVTAYHSRLESFDVAAGA